MGGARDFGCGKSYPSDTSVLENVNVIADKKALRRNDISVGFCLLGFRAVFIKRYFIHG